MKRTLGLTILSLVAMVSFALSGCSGTADSGMGLLEPFATSTPTVHPTGTVTPTPSPTVSPTPDPSPSVSPVPSSGIVINNLNNPSSMVHLDSFWVIDGFKVSNGGRLIRFSSSTKNNSDEGDPTIPQVMSLYDNGSRITLNGPSSIYGAYDPVNHKEVLAITDGFNVGTGRVMLVYPEVNDGVYSGKAEVNMVSTATTNPGFVYLDDKYLWWSEHIDSGSVYRYTYTDADPAAPAIYISGLSFPAGITCNGNYVAICENGGTTVRVGRSTEKEGASLPMTGVVSLTAAAGDNPLSRPYSAMWLPSNRLLVFTGYGLVGSAGSAGAGAGSIRLWTGPGSPDNITNTTLLEVFYGLNNPTTAELLYEACEDTVPRMDIMVNEAGSNTNNGQLRYMNINPINGAVNKQSVALTGIDYGYKLISVEGYTVSPVDGKTVPPPSYVNLFLTTSFLQSATTPSGTVSRYTSDVYPPTAK